ncbi:3',5'-cyclic adenosine monophosphate phosphodiesterase CpdA [Allostella vacuolata]|nr:3',5'-cyclic adenosine monophosphate phosphodiesterase CpdA [Stella vacuolata]
MRIAHITDTHIKPEGRLAYRRVDTAPFLERAVAHLNALQPRPDLVIATGDLVDAGLPEEYARLRVILSQLAMPFLLVPGNHDHRQALRDTFPDHPWMAGTDGFIQYALDEWPLRLVGLDTTEPGRDGGVFCAERARWLDRTLNESDRPTLLFLHHPPFATGMAYHDNQRVEGRERLASVLDGRRQVVWALCGHLHRTVTTIWAGVPMSAVASTAHQAVLDLAPDAELAFAMEPPACQLLLWQEGEGMLTHVTPIGPFDGPYPFYEGGRLID